MESDGKKNMTYTHIIVEMQRKFQKLFVSIALGKGKEWNWKMTYPSIVEQSSFPQS